MWQVLQGMLCVQWLDKTYEKSDIWNVFTNTTPLTESRWQSYSSSESRTIYHIQTCETCAFSYYYSPPSSSLLNLLFRSAQPFSELMISLTGSELFFKVWYSCIKGWLQKEKDKSLIFDALMPLRQRACEGCILKRLKQKDGKLGH